MPQEGAKPVYTETEIDDLITAEEEARDAAIADEATARNAAIAVHTAVASAHHAKYTNAEAVAAAQTVKLDDFTSPDDNTDLNASTSKHGLCPKGSGDSSQALKGDLTWGAAGASTFAALTDIQLVRKAADESLASNTTLQNDDELLFAMAANEVWAVKILVLDYSDSDTPDLKIGYSVPSGASLGGLVVGKDPTGTFIGDSIGATSTTAIRATNSVALAAIVSLVVINGANAGNFQLQWAQNTSNATATTVKANSCIIAHKLA